MNNEIKEILDNLKNTGYEKLAKNIENIIDYITNLQEKFEEADSDRHKLFEQKEKAIEYIENYCIGNLQYENKTHKVLLNILRGNDNE